MVYGYIKMAHIDRVQTNSVYVHIRLLLSHYIVPKHNEAYMCRKTSIDCISCSLFSDVLCNNDHLKLSVVRQIMPLDLIVPMRHDGSSYVSSFPPSL